MDQLLEELTNHANFGLSWQEKQKCVQEVEERVANAAKEAFLEHYNANK